VFFKKMPPDPPPPPPPPLERKGHRWYSTCRYVCMYVRTLSPKFSMDWTAEGPIPATSTPLMLRIWSPKSSPDL
jgi:hypothetical protein